LQGLPAWVGEPLLQLRCALRQETAGEIGLGIRSAAGMRPRIDDERPRAGELHHGTVQGRLDPGQRRKAHDLEVDDVAGETVRPGDAALTARGWRRRCRGGGTGGKDLQMLVVRHGAQVSGEALSGCRRGGERVAAFRRLCLADRRRGLPAHIGEDLAVLERAGGRRDNRGAGAALSKTNGGDAAGWASG
jgi:hypothetical protein